MFHHPLGQSWDEFEGRFEEEKDFEVRFRRQEQLAQYFVAQIQMLAKLCFGRSYNCISMLQVMTLSFFSVVIDRVILFIMNV